MRKNARATRVSLGAIMLAVLTALVAGSLVGTNAAKADEGDGPDVTPVFVAGNPSCASLGYDFEFKVDPPNAGTYNIDGVNTVTVTTDGVNFDWTSTLGMDAVIAKGGPNANAYVYDPPEESFGDDGLHSPINPSNGQPFGLSHISFCFDYELTASKTANPTYKRTYSWTIDKSVSPDSHAGFTGDSFTSDYDVVVDQTVADSDFAVSGSITVNNPTPFSVSFNVSDLVDGTAATVNCPTTTLAAGASTTCTYSASLGGAVDGTNVATITSSNSSVDGATASAPYDFGDPTTVVGSPTINVSDSVQGALGSASDDKTFEYSRTFTCDADEGKNDNTATIVETGQNDSASVLVTCYELGVTKTAGTSFDRDWTWTIDKSADQTNLLLSQGQLFTVNYEVEVSATSADSNHAVSGTISVNNPAPIAATLNAVSDVISGGIAATVDCGVTFPYTLAAGATLNCTYSANLPDGTNRTNTATATLQNTPSGTTDFSGSAAVSFGAPTNETDECIDVNDTNVGFLGTVCAADAPKTFSYNLTFGMHPDADVVLECGDNTHTNVADFETNDNGETGSDSWTVNASVACATGCTLTPGYWKTHSLHGPAPYDDAWLAIGPAGADTTFFLSGQTYYQVLWTAPAGNVYYILAHAYIAAKLNILNGASSTAAVDAAITAAESFFASKTPAQAAALKGAARAAAISNATTLDNYNNGLTGPGHCSE
jgi:hypothetical protein